MNEPRHFDGNRMTLVEMLSAERELSESARVVGEMAVDFYAGERRDVIQRVSEALVQKSDAHAVRAIRRLSGDDLSFLGLMAKYGVAMCSVECIRRDLRKSSKSN